MREIIVPDGEDHVEVDDLHKFLEGDDWEGNDVGIVLFVHALPGDKIIKDDKGGIQVVRRDK